MFKAIKRAFVWWQDCTWGTQWHTFRNGVRVGEDDQGNIYYKAKRQDSRWVIYNGDIDASRVPPEWHAWLHKTVDVPPSEAPPKVQSWEKEHKQNLTGTGGAYFPDGSLSKSGKRAGATGDYEAWTPDI